MKNNEIIEKLSQDEKLSLLADGKSAAGEKFAAHGIPKFKGASLDEINAKRSNIYPASWAIANSWNIQLISDAAFYTAAYARGKGVNVVYTSPVHVKSNPYSEGFSEDPYLSRIIAENQIEGIKTAKVVPCLYCRPLTAGDIKYLDDSADVRAIYDYFFAPFKLLDGDTTNVVITSYTRLSAGYERVNTNLFYDFLHAHMGEDSYILCDRVDDDLSVESFVAGTCISFGGNVTPLRLAAENYNRIRDSIDKGEYPEEELEKATGDYSAIGGDVIDSVADKAIDFALNSQISQDEQFNIDENAEKEFALNAGRESIVLLKNNGILPLSEKPSVAVIGDLAAKRGATPSDTFLQCVREAEEFELAGYAQGYDMARVRSDELMDEACKLATKADVVLLFLGLPDSAKERMASTASVKLPANQLALLSMLTKVNANIVAIVEGGEYSVDMNFDDIVPAVLVSELGAKFSARALIDVLSGKVSPAGRLTQAYYAHTDRLFEEIEKNKTSGNNKVGEFLGYRYFDSSKIKVKYPFGFGLSYTQFEYSDLEVAADSVSVSIKNVGDVGGYEVVQLYVGKKSSALVRPEKELKNFAKIYLEAGEKITVRFPFMPEMLAVYDEKTGKDVVEKGAYTVIVASSSQDIKLTGSLSLKGDAVARSGDRASDYLQSESNIKSKGYTLADVKKPQTKGRTLRKAGIILMIIGLFCAQLVAILHLGEVLSITEQKVWQVVLIACGVVVVVAAIMIIAAGVIGKRANEQAPVDIKKAQSDVPTSEQKTYERLFDEQFDEEQPKDAAKQTTTQTVDDDSDILRYIDPTMTFGDVCSQFTTFAAERGVVVDAKTARKVMSSVCSSRLLFIMNNSKEAGEKLVDVLAQFLGGKSYLSVLEHCSGVEDLYKGDSNEKSPFEQVMDDAPYEKQNACFATFEGVATEDITTMFRPFIKYASNPNGKCSFVCGGNKTEISQNLWFVMLFDRQSDIKGIDENIFECANFLDVNVRLIPEQAAKTNIKTVSTYQLAKLTDDGVENNLLAENQWKKIDALEEYVNTLSPFVLGNKKWQRLEKYSSAYIACGGEVEEALDNTISSEIMFVALKTIYEKSRAAEGLKDKLYNILGEDSCSECKNAMNIFGV